MKIAFITGITGQDGSYLTELLLEKDYYVHGLIRRSSLINTSRIDHVFENKNLFLHYGDLTDSSCLTSILSKIKNKYTDMSRLEIYNLAAQSHVKVSFEMPIYTGQADGIGVLNMLEAIKKSDCTRAIFTSTSEVYGDPAISPQSEEYYGNVNSFGPRSCYDEGKRCAEAILYSFRNDVDFFMGRIFNTYGPYMQKDDGRVISNFINQAIRNEDITVYGDGLQTRSFCYIDDMVRLLKSLITHKGKYQLPFNIGNPVEYTMIETANEIIKLSKSDSKIKFFDFFVHSNHI